MRKIIDREQFASLATSTMVSETNYITYYTKEQLLISGACTSTAFCDTVTVASIGWSDLNLVERGSYGSYYEYDGFTSGSECYENEKLRVWHFSSPIRQESFCDCAANTTVHVKYAGRDFYCCEEIARDEEAFRIFMVGILYPSIESVGTSNQCLQRTFEAVHNEAKGFFTASRNF